MSSAQRSENAKSAYATSPLAKINEARAKGAGFNAMKNTEDSKGYLHTQGYKLPTSSLDEYQAQSGEAITQINAGREPYLVDEEALKLGMHPLIEVWDVGIERQKVAKGEMISVCTQRGDALLSPDTLLVWR